MINKSMFYQFKSAINKCLVLSIQTTGLTRYRFLDLVHLL
jgi:hypothetical protein